MNQFAATAFGSLLTARQRAETLAGSTLGRWTLSHVVSSGGFSVVYKARHPELGDGAVKVLVFDSKQHPSIRSLFHREIRILKALTDEPGVKFVPRIYDAKISKGTGLAWIAMQHVDGETLEEWLKSRTKKPPRLAEVLEILGGVLMALAAVERAGRTGTDRNAAKTIPGQPGQCIVHGDIKPSNILIHTKDNHLVAWLLDFGIARIYEPLQSETISNASAISALGKRPMTVSYASPEMLAPRPSLDQRSDIFQVGLLGYEMITGHRYWDTWPAIDADLKQSKYPVWLKHIIRDALDWNRDRRYPDALSFLRGSGSRSVQPSRLPVGPSSSAITSPLA